MVEKKSQQSSLRDRHNPLDRQNRPEQPTQNKIKAVSTNSEANTDGAKAGIERLADKVQEAVTLIDVPATAKYCI